MIFYNTWIGITKPLAEGREGSAHQRTNTTNLITFYAYIFYLYLTTNVSLQTRWGHGREAFQFGYIAQESEPNR